MGFSRENGYVPTPIATIMQLIMDKVNENFGTAYTVDSFAGTGFYKYLYGAAQLMAENDIKTSEIFLKLQQYIDIVNERIGRPITTAPGLQAKLDSEGYVASVKPMIDADAGKIYVAVNLDNTAPGYSTLKDDVNAILKNSTVLGAVTQGTEVTNFVLSNGQVFAWKFKLPVRRTTLLKLTITLSENNQYVIKTPEQIKFDLLANLDARYRFGKNFEPQRYYSLADAPWASQVKLEYSINGGTTWLTTVYDANYDDLFEYKFVDITLIEV